MDLYWTVASMPSCNIMEGFLYLHILFSLLQCCFCIIFLCKTAHSFTALKKALGKTQPGGHDRSGSKALLFARQQPAGWTWHCWHRWHACQSCWQAFSGVNTEACHYPGNSLGHIWGNGDSHSPLRLMGLLVITQHCYDIAESLR